MELDYYVINVERDGETHILFQEQDGDVGHKFSEDLPVNVEQDAERYEHDGAVGYKSELAVNSEQISTS